MAYQENAAEHRYIQQSASLPESKITLLHSREADKPLGWAVCLLLLLPGFLVLLLGLLKNPDVFANGWQDVPSRENFLWLVGAITFAFPVAFFLPARLLWSSLWLGLGAVAMWQVGSAPLMAAGLLLLASYSIGSWFSITKPWTGNKGADEVIQTTAGMVILSCVIGVAAHFKVNYSSVYISFLASIVVLHWRRIAALAGSFLRKQNREAPRPLIARLLDRVLQGLCASAIAVLWFQVLRSELMHDGLYTHLWLPAQVSYLGYFHFDPEIHLYSLIPYGVDWLYTACYLIGGESGARIFNFSALLLIARMLWLAAGPRFAPLLVALFLSMPLAYVETTSLFVENTWALAGLAAFWVTIRMLARPSIGTGVLLGVLCGGCMAFKVTSLFFLFTYAALIVGKMLIDLFRDRPTSWLTLKSCAVSLPFVIVVGGYQYFRSFLISGNPLFPFYNAVFQSPYFETRVNFDNVLWHKPLSFRSWYDLVFHTNWYLEAGDGGFCFHLLAFSPLLLLGFFRCRSLPGRCALGCGAVFIALVFPLQAYLRYFYPAIVLLHLGMAYVLRSTGRYTVVAALGIITIALNMWIYPAGTWPYRDFPVLRDPYVDLFYKAPERLMVAHLNQLDRTVSPKNVFFLGGASFGEFHGEPLSVEWYTYEVSQRYAEVRNSDSLEKFFSDYDIGYVVVGNQGYGRPVMMEFLHSRGLKLLQEGQGQLYRIQPRNLDWLDLAVNGNFSAPLSEGWYKQGDVQYGPAKEGTSVLVDPENYLSQPVTVVPGESYSYQVTARLFKGAPAQVRFQINWLDATGGFVSTSLSTEPLGERGWQNFSTQLIAPEGAKVAVVFVMGSEVGSPIEVKNFSFGNLK